MAQAGKKLVIVESPTKAKTIRKFLGKDFIVESCMGHVRDLPQSSKEIPEKFKKEKWAQLGVNVSKDFEPIYCVPKTKSKVVSALKEKLSEADELYLATDEDREGESISWHLKELLKPKVPVKRMVFHEITKEAIEKSLKKTRDIDLNLVRAQEARRILDRLVGYSISPLLWKKIAFGLSAGRVQSVAVRLISERELERYEFKKAQYFGLLAENQSQGVSFESRLVQVAHQKIAIGKDFDDLGRLKDPKLLLLSKEASETLLARLKGKDWKVSDLEEKPLHRKPAAPFITSTLQQEANRKLGLGAKEAMQVAQKLYEQGYITYMRTDSTFLSEEAISAARNCISEKYGKNYLPAQPRTFDGKKVKGAQEAHEAIRPAGHVFKDPDQTDLDGVQLKMYELIWKRTVASQMVDSQHKQVTARIQVEDCIFTSHGQTIEFPGFLRAYVEGSDDPEMELSEKEVRLPQLKVGEILKLNKLKSTEHETKPPARYTEASLVQKMEKEGIGRPSTYASIISTIIDRGYVRKQATALIPTFTALVVVKLLKNHLTQFVDLDFTSQMEKSLDQIADGDLDSIKYLHQIYNGKEGLRAQLDQQEKKIDPVEARSLTMSRLDNYIVRVGKFGAYVCKITPQGEICASIPDQEAPAEIQSESIEKWIESKQSGQDSLGKDPKSGLPVYALSGRYGPYVQLGDSDADSGAGKGAQKPKRVSLPPEKDLAAVTLQEALQWLSLPMTLGVHPHLKKPVQLGQGRFGPYVVCDGDFRSIPKGLPIFSVDFKQALELLSQPKKGRGKAAPIKDLGTDPRTGYPVQIYNGPYGFYVKLGKTNASLPKEQDPMKLSLQQALDLVGAKEKAAC